MPVFLAYAKIGHEKTAFCICENKATDQLSSKWVADLPLYFHYMGSTIPLLSKSKISSLNPSSAALKSSLCPTWLEIPKTGFLLMQLM